MMFKSDSASCFDRVNHEIFDSDFGSLTNGFLMV